MELSSECNVQRTTAGKAEFIISSESRFFWRPAPDARTTDSKISSETGWSPDKADFSGPEPPSRMETKVGTSLFSSDARQPTVWAKTLKMS